ncbi:hypothetical protein [Herbaspirillum sp. RV1423]|uniref:T6SS immunity protein Tli3 family protein n=1 Tax=Herbaspirillum sp. RV1423 TaxID=1443993 RepID=UPI0004ADA39C|nr:hypothetical protein [Herbaspirillum sp. RV1423]
MKTTTLKEKMMDVIKIMGAMLFSIGVAGCVTELPELAQRNYPPAKFDVPPQVLYKIDDNRFISLENYQQCFGDTYYIDKKLGIREELGRGGIERYRGRLIIDDPTGMNIVIPSAPPGSCGSRGCNASLIYSTDGGRTFKGMVYMNHPNPEKASENYSILVAKDGFYVVKTTEYGKGKIDNAVTKYPLAPGIEYGTVAGLPKEYHIEYLSNKPLPPLRTPSGQDRFTCDASVRPSNLPKEK